MPANSSNSSSKMTTRLLSPMRNPVTAPLPVFRERPVSAGKLEDGFTIFLRFNHIQYATYRQDASQHLLNRLLEHLTRFLQCELFLRPQFDFDDSLNPFAADDRGNRN